MGNMMIKNTYIFGPLDPAYTGGTGGSGGLGITGGTGGSGATGGTGADGYSVYTGGTGGTGKPGHTGGTGAPGYSVHTGGTGGTSGTGGTGADGHAVYTGGTGGSGCTPYEIAVQNGFTGTEEQWLQLLSARIPGEVIYSLIPINDPQLVLLDGSELDVNGIYSNTINNIILPLINTHPNLFTTQTAWNTSVNTYGVCGKFVYDDINNTLRLPKVTGLIEGTLDENALGDLVQAGLPNISGNFYARPKYNSPGSLVGADGAFTYSRQATKGNTSPITIGDKTYYNDRVTFSAARSNNIYGKSSKVQPQTIKGFVYMVFGRGLSLPSTVLLEQYLRDLNSLREEVAAQGTGGTGGSGYSGGTGGTGGLGFSGGTGGTSGTGGTGGIGYTGGTGGSGFTGGTGGSGGLGYTGGTGGTSGTGGSGDTGGTGGSGADAYQIALNHGFIGTYQEWLDTITHSIADLPIGSLISFTGLSNPVGFLDCDGSAVSRTDYAELFRIIGTTFGEGDGSTTFNLPDYRDKFIEGSDTPGIVKEAGLPNINQSTNIRAQQYGSPSATAALYTNTGTVQNKGWQWNNTTSNSYTPNVPVYINLSRANAIYGKSTTVQPSAITARILIKAIKGPGITLIGGTVTILEDGTSPLMTLVDEGQNEYSLNLAIPTVTGGTGAPGSAVYTGDTGNTGGTGGTSGTGGTGACGTGDTGNTGGTGGTSGTGGSGANAYEVAVNHGYQGSEPEWLNDLAAHRNVGELVYSLLPLSDPKLVLLNGALLNTDGPYANTINTVILPLTNTHADLFIDETSWQTSVSTYGVCGKFVYDDINNTLRLPKVTGIFEGTLDENALGDLVQAGLPNITGEMAIRPNNGNYWGIIQAGSGAIRGTMHGINNTASPIAVNSSASAQKFDKFVFNASYSNTIYGNSTTVQPQTIKGYIYMVFADSLSIPSLSVDLLAFKREILAEAAQAAMPSSNIINYSLPSSYPHTIIAPDHGYIAFARFATAVGQYITVNNITTGFMMSIPSPTTSAALRAWVPCSKGDNIGLGCTAQGNFEYLRFIYSNGSNPLNGS